jgi:HEAT repeat protein
MGSHRHNLQFARVILAILVLLGTTRPAIGQPGASATVLLEQFKANWNDYFKQFEVSQKLVKLNDITVLDRLKQSLTDEDRHVRGNAAFVFAALGDDRGFEVIRDILKDRSDRPMRQYAGGNWSVEVQIANDRYYAAHLFGDLKDARAVPILIPLLKDQLVNWIVPWSLGEIGDKRAVPPLIQTLSDRSPDMRVLSIYALETLKAKEAVPQLHLLLDDYERIHFDGLGTVAEAAKAAIAKLRSTP